MKKNSYRYSNIDFTGKRFHKLLVIEKAKKGRSWWVCKCDCGNIVTLPTFRLFEYKSCGCLEKINKATLGERNKTHGMTKTVLYHKWCDMKSRCNNPNDEHYNIYGGRGIKVCDEWLHSFISFKEWAYASGYDDNKKLYEQTLDRIDVNKDYCPDNCRWVDQKTQSNNRQNTVYIDYQGKSYPLTIICEMYDIERSFASRYLRKGKDFDFILKLWNSKDRIVHGRVRKKK